MVTVASSDRTPLVSGADIEAATTDATVDVEKAADNHLVLVSAGDDDVTAAVFVDGDASAEVVRDAARDLDAELQYVAGAVDGAD